LDYVLILTRLPQLLDSIDGGDDQPMSSGATAQQEIDDLVRRVPNVIENLPGVFDRSWSTDRRHIAARGEMIRSLVEVTERVSPDVLVRVAFWLSKGSRLMVLFNSKCRHRYNNPHRWI